MTPNYHYSRLAVGHIRLMRLECGQYDEPLHCTLTHLPIDHSGLYFALSYCWSTSVFDQTLECDGTTLRITENLSQALRRIRQPHCCFSMWVDQICINQDDLEEKETQVLLMGSIFSKAAEVLIWLGDHDERTSIAFRLLEGLESHVSESYRAGHRLGKIVDLRDRYCHEWEAFRSTLLECPWNERIWVFQEFVLARDARFIRGAFSVKARNLGHIIQLVELGDDDLPSHQGHLPFVRAGQVMFPFRAWLSPARKRRQDQAGKPAASHADFLDSLNNRLIQLLQTLRNRKSTDPRDKIYALLGVADFVPQSIQPNYNTHYRDVYALTTRALIDYHKDLTVLRLVDIAPSTLNSVGCRNLPSWVPDYSYDDMPNLSFPPGSAFLHTGQKRVWNASGNTEALLQPEDTCNLTVSGLLVDTISITSPPSENFVCGKAIGPALQQGGSWEQLALSIACEGSYSHTGEPIMSAYYRTLSCDMFESNKDTRIARIRSGLPIKFPNLFDFEIDPVHGHLTYDEQTTMPSAILTTLNRRCFATTRGYLGLCHQTCVPGDQVWILLGGDMPFIVRPLEDDKFEFKGQCYVHGIMDGEFLLQQAGLDHRVPFAEDQQDWLRDLSEPYPFAVQNITLT